MAPHSRYGKNYRVKPFHLVVGFFVSIIVVYEFYIFGTSVCSTDTLTNGIVTAHTNAAHEIANRLRQNIPLQGSVHNDLQPTNNHAAGHVQDIHDKIDPQVLLKYNSRPDSERDSVAWGESLPGMEDPDQWPGFPSKPLTLEDLRLCDAKQTITLKDHEVCETDPTCQECLSMFKKRNKKLMDAFDTKIAKSPEWLRLARQESDGDRVVVMALNYGQIYFAMNWYLSVKANTNLDPCEFALVIATDQQTYDSIKAESCMRVFFADMSDVGVDSKYHQEIANRGSHWAINTVLFLAVDNLVQMGKRVLMQDVDVVWLRDPFPMLDKYSTGMDMSCMYSQYLNAAKGICNTGFVYTQPSFKSKLFWKTMTNAMMIKRTSDQSLFNTILRHRLFFQYMYRPLPLPLFNKRGSSKKHFNPDSTLVYHAVSVKKVNQMVIKDLWYYKKEKLIKADDGLWYFGTPQSGASK